MEGKIEQISLDKSIIDSERDYEFNQFEKSAIEAVGKWRAEKEGVWKNMEKNYIANATKFRQFLEKRYPNHLFTEDQITIVAIWMRNNG